MRILVAVLFSLVLLIGCVMVEPIPPYTGPLHDTEPTSEGRVSKVLAEASPEIILRRYIIRSTSGNKIGVYKIEIGSQEKIRRALLKIRFEGFNGVTYQRWHGSEKGWVRVRIEVDVSGGISPKVADRQIVSKTEIYPEDIPRNLGKLKHLVLIERVNVYDAYPEALSIFIEAGTTIPEAYELMYEIKEILDEY